MKREDTDGFMAKRLRRCNKSRQEGAKSVVPAGRVLPLGNCHDAPLAQPCIVHETPPMMHSNAPWHDEGHGGIPLGMDGHIAVPLHELRPGVEWAYLRVDPQAIARGQVSDFGVALALP